MKQKDLLRILDANLNRVREALRVCEEITRFVLKDKNTTGSLKRLRHRVLNIFAGSCRLQYRLLVLSRDVKADVGKVTITSELRRKKAFDILGANLQRSKESLRVLEEFCKIIDSDIAQKVKKIRFRVYRIEKDLLSKF